MVDITDRAVIVGFVFGPKEDESCANDAHGESEDIEHAVGGVVPQVADGEPEGVV